jgi:hypothetical protein
MKQIAKEAIEECHEQLGKELSTEVRCKNPSAVENMSPWLFWPAEEYHQQHDEKQLRQKKSLDPNKSQENNDDTYMGTLTPTQWLSIYGKRSPSVIGSFQNNEFMSSDPILL